MTTKKKIILTILLAVLVAGLIYMCIVYIQSISSNMVYINNYPNDTHNISIKGNVIRMAVFLFINLLSIISFCVIDLSWWIKKKHQ